MIENTSKRLRLYNINDFDSVKCNFASSKYIDKYLNKPIIFKILKHIKLYESFFYVLEIDYSEIVAIGVLRRKFHLFKMKNTFWLYGIEVSLLQRRKEYGTILVLKLLEILKCDNIKKAYLKVDKKNTIAFEMYTKLGFVVYSVKSKNLIMRIDL